MIFLRMRHKTVRGEPMKGQGTPGGRGLGRLARVIAETVLGGAGYTTGPIN